MSLGVVDVRVGGGSGWLLLDGGLEAVDGGLGRVKDLEGFFLGVGGGYRKGLGLFGRGGGIVERGLGLGALYGEGGFDGVDRGSFHLPVAANNTAIIIISLTTALFHDNIIALTTIIFLLLLFLIFIFNLLFILNFLLSFLFDPLEILLHSLDILEHPSQFHLHLVLPQLRLAHILLQLGIDPTVHLLQILIDYCVGSELLVNLLEDLVAV